jgi:hypothetical protein
MAEENTIYDNYSTGYTKVTLRDEDRDFILLRLREATAEMVSEDVEAKESIIRIFKAFGKVDPWQPRA